MQKKLTTLRLFLNQHPLAKNKSLIIILILVFLIPISVFAVLTFTSILPRAANVSTTKKIDNAQFISQQVPTEMIAGQSYEISITMKNTGTTTWNWQEQYKLGSRNPRDNFNWGSNRTHLKYNQSVAPGEEYTFKFTITAPLILGKYNFQYRMVKEYIRWFGSFSNNIQVNVISGPFSDIPGPYIKDNLPIEEAESFSSQDKILFTYYFYWYEQSTGYHTYIAPVSFYASQGNDLLVDHPVTWPSMENPEFSFRNVEWHKKQIKDMIDAGVDVFLPIYWGTSLKDGHETWWSNAGMRKIIQAMEELEAEGYKVPKIGMFYDTTTLTKDFLINHDNDVNLTTDKERPVLYETIRNFYSLVPPKFYAQIDNKPIAWLYASFNVVYDQSAFDYAYNQFPKDFKGKGLYIVSGGGWERAKTDNNYSWGGARRGPELYYGITSIGPGFNDTDVREPFGKPARIRERENGQFYRDSWNTVISNNRKLVVLETWNEFHEGSDIADSYEYGKKYINITREKADEWKGISTTPPSPTPTPQLQSAASIINGYVYKETDKNLVRQSTQESFVNNSRATVYYKKQGSSSWKNAGSFSSCGNPFEIKGLEKGSYDFKIAVAQGEKVVGSSVVVKADSNCRFNPTVERRFCQSWQRCYRGF